MSGRVRVAQVSDLPFMRRWLRHTDAGSFDRVTHRKHWEKGWVCGELWRAGLLCSGSRGLGFGVGNDKLPAYFAGLGCEVLATDLDPADRRAAQWAATGQHCAGVEWLRDPALCEGAAFEARCSFRGVDMNKVPDDLTGFDFCWSVSALDHLGSVGQALEFVRRSVRCLRPGGLAVHVTEFNLSENPLRYGPVSVLEAQHVGRLAKEFSLDVDLSLGDTPADRHVDRPPYFHNPHFRVMLPGCVIVTSIGFSIRRES
jgi:SAM-dependent methyltransferase